MKWSERDTDVKNGVKKVGNFSQNIEGSTMHQSKKLLHNLDFAQIKMNSERKKAFFLQNEQWQLPAKAVPKSLQQI